MRVQIRMSEEVCNKIDSYKAKKFGREASITRGYTISVAYEEMRQYINEIDWGKITNKISGETTTTPTTINFRQDVLRAIDELVSFVSVELGEKNIYRSTVIELIVITALMILEDQLPYKKLNLDEEDIIKDYLGGNSESNARKTCTMLSSQMIEILSDITYRVESKKDTEVLEPLLSQIKDILIESEYVQKRYDVIGSGGDNSPLAYYFYNKCFLEEIELAGINGIRFAGDTICSLGTTFGICNKQGKFESLIDGNMWKRSYTKIMKSVDEYIFYLFRDGYKKIENYIFIPLELNIWRGKEDKDVKGLPNQGDYFDLFFDLVRNWYTDKEKNTENVNNMLSKHDYWFDKLGNGEQGWKNFIEHYMCKSMVNIDYTVKDIFSLPEEYNQSMAPVVGTYHSYGSALPQHTDNPKMSAMNYAKNSLWIWKQRQEEIIKRLFKQ